MRCVSGWRWCCGAAAVWSLSCGWFRVGIEGFISVGRVSRNEMDEDVYSAALNHIAEPQRPSERKDTVSVLCDDYEALWFVEPLLEYAYYADTSDEESVVAEGYAEYIERKVREEGVSNVRLYAHTSTAASVLLDALHNHRDDECGGYPIAIANSLEDAFTDVLVHYAMGE